MSAALILLFSGCFLFAKDGVFHDTSECAVCDTDFDSVVPDAQCPEGCERCFDVCD